MWYVWLILAGVFFVAEMATVGFLVFWLGIGALVAMIVSFITSNIVIQTSVFIVSSIILLFSTKPLVKKFIDVEPTKTNAFSIIGKKALVIKTIDPIKSTGQIKINGEVWSAETENGQIVSEGSEVEILEIKGVKTIVQEVSKV